MAREHSPYIVGDFWLDRRRDGKSPDVWQIARYVTGSRSVVYKSTRTGDLEKAKGVIHAHVQAELAKKPQQAEDAEVLPQLFLYWREHGRDVRNPDVIAGSLRAFIGFLMQDEVGLRARFADLTEPVFQRFMAWRMHPHRFAVTWEGREIATDSKGVKGESVKRNLEDVRAALSHAVRMRRVPHAPPVPTVPLEHRSPPRDVRVSLETLGAMIAVSSQNDRPEDDGDQNVDFRRWLWLLIGTSCRPEAGLAFDPTRQWTGDLLDLHPPEWPRKEAQPGAPRPGSSRADPEGLGRRALRADASR